MWNLGGGTNAQSRAMKAEGSNRPAGKSTTVLGSLTLTATAVLNNSGTMTVGTCVVDPAATITGTNPCP